MTFALTDTLTNNIVSALENQETKFFLDANSLELIEVTESVKADNDTIYELPEWTSSDGFQLRESFTAKVSSPIVKEKLKEVLHSGRGVFRNFRNVIKVYPEVEKRWHLYKNRIMLAYINDWYNGLREMWGLEKLDYFPESDENLIHDDFSFRQFNFEKDKECVISYVNNEFLNDRETLPDLLKSALYEMWRNQFEYSDASCKIGFMCQSLSEEFAGCITTSAVKNTQEQVFQITSLFVPEQFRGLGIATELLSMCLSELKRSGKQYILLPDIIIPEIIKPLLFRNGFEEIESGLAAKLQ